MDIFVAPTIINLENPTFWINNLGQVHVSASDKPKDGRNSDRDRTIPNPEKDINNR